MKLLHYGAILTVLLWLCAEQRPALAQPSVQAFDVTLQQLGYTDALLHGPTDAVSYGIVLPVTWQPVLSNTLMLDVSLTNSSATVFTELDGAPIGGGPGH